MSYIVNRRRFLEYFILTCFLASFMAGMLLLYQSYFPPAYQLKIDFTLGINKSLSSETQAAQSMERIAIFKDGLFVADNMRFCFADQQEEASWLDKLKSAVTLAGDNNLASAVIEHNSSRCVKDLAADIVAQFRDRMQQLQKEKEKQLTHSIELLDQDITALIKKGPQIKEEIDKELQDAQEKAKLRRQLSDWQRQSLVKRYVDSYIDVIRLESMMRLLRDKKLSNADYLQFPEMADYGEMRHLLSLANILRSQIALASQDPARQKELARLQTSQAELQIQIDAEAEGFLSQLHNKIILAKEVINKIAHQLGDALLASDRTFSPVSRDDNGGFDSFERFKAKLHYYFTKRENLELEKLQLMHELGPIVLASQQWVGPSYFLAYENYIFYGLLSILLIAIAIFFTIRFFAFGEGAGPQKAPNMTLKQVKDKADSAGIAPMPALITAQQLLRRIFSSAIKRIAFFGAYAEQEAAAMLMEYRKSGKKILLIEIAGNELARYIGPHLGLLDVLANVATLDEAIYRDVKLGVDILAKGRAAEIAMPDTASGRLANLLAHLEKYYDSIFILVTGEPFAALPDFLTKDTQIIICTTNKLAHEASLWVNLLQICGFNRLFLLKD